MVDWFDKKIIGVESANQLILVDNGWCYALLLVMFITSYLLPTMNWLILQY